MIDHHLFANTVHTHKTETDMTHRMRIYGAGGCGCNRVNAIMERGLPTSNRAEVLPAVLDTSRSNLQKSNLGEDSVYLVPDLDGSGKLRHENHREISKSIKNMLNQIPPDDFNVVIFSASGGLPKAR